MKFCCKTFEGTQKRDGHRIQKDFDGDGYLWSFIYSKPKGDDPIDCFRIGIGMRWYYCPFCGKKLEDK